MSDEITNNPDGEKDVGGDSPSIDGLRAFYEKANLPPPEELSGSIPPLYIGRPADELGRQVADHLRGRNILFRRGRSIVTVDHDGLLYPMTPNRFVTWLPKYGQLLPCMGKTKDGDLKKVSMDSKLAALILADDELLVKLPEIKKVNPIRIPVFGDPDPKNPDAPLRLELAQPGYHAPTKTFTIHSGIDYDEKVSAKDAKAWLKRLFRYFPWGNGQPQAVQLAAMLTVFCRRLFSGNSPLFAWTSNVGGPGKSRLSDLVLCTLFARPTSFGYDQRDQRELKSTLDAVAATGKDYLRFDDFELPDGVQLRSNHLNRWVTSDTWETRTFGKNNETFEVEIETTTLITGVKLDLEAQLMRRTLFIDLFATEKLEERRLPEDALLLTKQLVQSDEFRAELLGVLWALLRSWDEAGRPVTKEKQLNSFEGCGGWSELVPSIVEFHGFGNALEPFVAPDAGDTKTAEFNQLAQALIREFCIDQGLKVARLSTPNVISTARRHGLFAEVLWTTEAVASHLEAKREWKFTDADGEPLKDGSGMDVTHPAEIPKEEKERQALEYSDPKIGSSWGKKWKSGAVDGQVFTVDGRRWQFGKRGDSGRAAFVIQELAEGEAADQSSDREATSPDVGSDPDPF